MIPNVSTAIPAVVRNAPVQSNGAPLAERGMTGMNRTPSAITTTATGTLSRNTDRQPISSTSNPPTAGPKASASPEPDDHTPIAPARERGSSNVEEMIARLVGVTMAGPRPWITRPASSQSTDGATPASSDPSPNSDTPVMNMPLRPRRPLRTPPGMSRPARTLAQA